MKSLLDWLIYSFMHSPFQIHYYSEALPDTVLEFHAKAPQATAIEGLAQGPYLAASAGFESTTLWSTGIDSTNEPPCPTATTPHIYLS